MAQNTIAIRRRIKSVNNTLQITRAMELVATSKLQRHRNRMLKDKVYADMLYKVMGHVLKEFEDDRDAAELSPYLAKPKNDRSAVIVFGADTGMCGAYNTNLDKFFAANVKADDLLIICGNKPIRFAAKNGLKAYAEYPAFDHADSTTTRLIANQAMELFTKGEVGSIRIIFTEYVNGGTFVPEVRTLLPMDKPEDLEETSTVEVLFEPSASVILDQLIPMYIRNVMYSLMLRSKTSEQASRRLAMETASDNAVDLVDQLTLEYNKARQAAITQEITELSTSAMAGQQ